MHIPRSICSTCNLEMTTAKQGVTVEMLMADGSGYYKIMADRVECPDCGAGVLAGVPREAIAEHYMERSAGVKADVQAHFAGEN